MSCFHKSLIDYCKLKFQQLKNMDLIMEK